MPNYSTTQIPSVRDPATYAKLPAPPKGEASWLSKSIYQPYFTPYDVNWLVWDFKVATYAKFPASGIRAFATTPMPQPFITQDIIMF